MMDEKQKEPNLMEQQNYKNYLKVFLMSKATGNNSELLSIASGLGMGKIGFFGEALLEVNQEIKKANVLSPLSFEVVEISSDGLNVNSLNLIESKLKTHNKHIVLVDGAENLSSDERKGLVDLAKNNQATMVFSSTLTQSNAYSVNTNMNEFVALGKKDELLEDNFLALLEMAQKLKALEPKNMYYVVSDKEINHTIVGNTFDKTKIKTLRDLNDVHATEAENTISKELMKKHSNK